MFIIEYCAVVADTDDTRRKHDQSRFFCHYREECPRIFVPAAPADCVTSHDLEMNR